MAESRFLSCLSCLGQPRSPSQDVFLGPQLCSSPFVHSKYAESWSTRETLRSPWWGICVCAGTEREGPEDVSWDVCECPCGM